MTKSFSVALSAAMLSAIGVGSAAAQSDADRMAALEARISALESGPDPASGGLSFGTESNIELELYGYIKADFFYDFGADLGDTTFPLGALDGSAEDGDYFGATARQTRLGFRTTSQTSFGELGSQVEVDFYGGSSSSPEIRLRHATVTLGGLRLGRYWSSFMPLSSYPVTLDFQGVAGIPFARKTQASYEFDISGNFGGEVAIEEANGESDDPVLIGALSYDTDPLLLRASAIAGTVSDGFGGDEDVYGFNLSTTAQLWEGATLDAAYTYGDGISSYMVFLANDDVDGSGDAIEMQAAYLGLAQEVGEDLTLRAIYGYYESDTGASSATESLSTVHLSAIYQLLESTSVGIEYFHGERDTFAGDNYDVDRIQTSVQFDF